MVNLLGICLAPCIGDEEIDVLHMIFFASGHTNAVIVSNVSGFFPILSLLLYSICRKKAQKAKNNEQTFF